MPAEVDKCVKALKRQGKSEDSAWSICWAAYNRKRETMANKAKKRRKK